MSRIFGIGWAKTGTTTLGRCFDILGFDHQGQRLDLVKDVRRGDLSRILRLVARREAFEDWPWIIIYKELDKAFPGSRFILTQRDADRWVRSYLNMLAHEPTASEGLNAVRQFLYRMDTAGVSRERLIERYLAHNHEVLAYFADRPRDLIVLNWERGDGWTELCGFLGTAIPDAPFPHENRGRYGRKTVAQRLATRARRWLQRGAARER